MNTYIIKIIRPGNRNRAEPFRNNKNRHSLAEDRRWCKSIVLLANHRDGLHERRSNVGRLGPLLLLLLLRRRLLLLRLRLLLVLLLHHRLVVKRHLVRLLVVVHERHWKHLHLVVVVLLLLLRLMLAGRRHPQGEVAAAVQLDLRLSRHLVLLLRLRLRRRLPLVRHLLRGEVMLLLLLRLVLGWHELEVVAMRL